MAALDGAGYEESWGSHGNGADDMAWPRSRFGGKKLISRILARAGWKVSARSVGRYRKARLAPTPVPENPGSSRLTRPVVTRFVHHTWMMDVTQIRQFLGPTLHLAAVLEAHSRVPLILRVYQACPDANDRAALLRRDASARWLRPAPVGGPRPQPRSVRHLDPGRRSRPHLAADSHCTLTYVYGPRYPRSVFVTAKVGF